MARLFGTDGVRGVANKELTVELAMNLGKAGAYVLTKENSHKATILVGCDTRISGDMLANALMAGICSVGANAIYAGVIPTPAIAYLTRKYNCDAGVVVSASHNPAEYNGIKFFGGTGYKLSDQLEDEIEEYIRVNLAEFPMPLGGDVGRITYLDKAKDDYVNFATDLFDMDLSGLKIVVDTAEGASYYTAEKALRKLSADPLVIHNNPDGVNINRNCGSTHLEELKKTVIENGADIGIAFDGDADRMLAVDEKGNVVDGDQVMAICGLYMKNKGTLKKNTITATVMSNLGFFQMGERENINIEQTKVGDRYVLERMLKEGYNIGGEQSGHVIFLDFATTGDGELSGVQLIETVVKSGKKLSELAKIMKVYPQVLINVRVTPQGKEKYNNNEYIISAVQQAEMELMGEGRVLVRVSGTEPLIRVMLEGSDLDKITVLGNKIANVVKERLS